MKRKTSHTYEPGQSYFLTTTITGFTPIFHRPELSRIMLDILMFSLRKFKISLHGYVIMPNHFHLLLTMGDVGNVSEFMGQVKGYSAKQIIQWCKENGKQKILEIFHQSALKYKAKQKYQVWQQRFDDLVIFDDDMFNIKLNYIHGNPVQEHWQLVKSPEEYDLSSARYYILGERVDLPVVSLMNIGSPEDG